MIALPDLTHLLTGHGTVLLDFDGPVCSIFANHPAPAVADALRTVARDVGVRIPAALADERDPLEVLKWSASCGRPEVVKAVETALCAEEFTAAQSSNPTPFGRETIIGAYEAGKILVIVSNNSAGAIRAYLRRQRLTGYVKGISGRTFTRPDLMKPNPEPLFRAAKAADSNPSDCVLIGDTLADINGARAAELPVIGYANRPYKLDQFKTAGADAIVTTMADVARALIELKV